ncbi:MAG: glycosyltransferase family 39 protein [Defluviitaleaceae bacterium]|nr:glycosyltransferase family 39 protein [Defluviitaleaceae bacterium]
MKKALANFIPLAWMFFYALFLITFIPGIMFIFFGSRIGLSPILLPLITLTLALPVLIGGWRITGRISGYISEKAHRRILIIFMVLSAVVQLYIGNRLRFVPMWDVEAIFHGGRMWAITGSLDNYRYAFGGTYLQYMARKSVQWGGAFLFRTLFQVYSFFGGTDLHYPALVWNVAMVQVMVFAIYSAAKRIKGLQAGMYVLFLLTIFLPFHFFGGVYYTDTLSMPFVAIAFSLYLRGKDEGTLKKKLLFFAIAGVAAAIGGVLKGTAIIIFIAIIIDLLLTMEKGWKQRLLSAGAMIIAFLLVYGGFYMYMSRVVIGPELTARYRLPRTLWMMMGLEGYGQYNTNDYRHITYLPNVAARQSEATRIFNERLRGHGVRGMANLWSAKMTINFGDGTFEMHRIYHLAPVNQSPMHDMVLSHGRYFNAYLHVATGFTTAMYLLMVAAAFRAFIRPGRHKHTAVPWLSIFGLMLLLTFWESGGRLSMSYFSVLVIGAIIGISTIEPLIAAFYKNFPRKGVFPASADFTKNNEWC